MITSTQAYLLLTVLASIAFTSSFNLNDEYSSELYLTKLENQFLLLKYNSANAAYNYAVNMTEANAKESILHSSKVAEYLKLMSEEVEKINYHSFKSIILRNRFKYYSSSGFSALPQPDFEEYSTIVNKMTSNFEQVTVCDYNNKTNCNLGLNPDLIEIFRKSRDPAELAYYWREFYDKAGTPVRPLFERYLELVNKAATLRNYTSGAELWLSDYDDDNFEQQLENILAQLKPLYQQIHGYVRHRLREYYGDNVVSENGPIPMHLLGYVFAESWDKIAEIVAPFPHKPVIDITEEMIKQGYTARKIYEIGDDFYTSLNLTKLPQTFWNKSMLEKPSDGRKVVCHGSAFDMLINDDVRIKHCAQINQNDFVIAHHELGHIQYFLQYRHLPLAFRDSPNQGFHEAIGDTIALSATTPKHLQRIGLLKDYKNDEEARINNLFAKALEKIVIMSFAFTLDKYRWALFRGEIKKSEWNCAFWKLREVYSGIEPPVIRTEKDFDAPAKYHVSADVEYLRYLVAVILQFQFHKTACLKAGQYVPGDPELTLDTCDIYGNADVGKAFHDMLSLGSLASWPNTLQTFTGERDLNVNAILEYFEPLYVWLKAENKKHNAPIGWTVSNKCVSSVEKN